MPRLRSLLLRILLGIVGLLILLLGGAWITGCLLSGPGYHGPVSDHFDGERFTNQLPIHHRRFGEFLRWMRSRQPGEWQWIDAEPGPPPPRRVTDGRLRVTFVNHATVLIQMDGLNVLTDPIWSERASPFAWIGPRRMRPPGIRFADLPPIDVVLLSHNHYDHFDAPTLRRLEAEHRPLFVTGLGNGPLLQELDIETARIRELDWWQKLDLGHGRRLHAVPAQHFSARGLCDRDAALWAGYVFEGPSGRVYFAGDTGFGPHFRQIRERFGPPRLALLPIGAYRPEWFMARVHISPAVAVRAHKILGAGTSIGIHFGTFRLADDGQTEPLKTLARVLANHPPPQPRFWTLAFGEGRDIPRRVDAHAQVPGSAADPSP